ncbi:MAG: GNAT family N-acetyltransferase [Hyphomonadaceae bacterium]|nr:GNAT family N-acetyltransferase [Hyphomonadaceae bacterium]
MAVQVVRCIGLPDMFAQLRDAARAEGYAFLDRLDARWRNDAYDGDASACVLAAFIDGDIAAIGAQTFDEYDPHPDHRRLRHVYVIPAHRRGGVGRAVAGALIQEAFAIAPILHVRATHAGSIAFWDAMGFERLPRRPDRTHWLTRA